MRPSLRSATRSVSQRSIQATRRLREVLALDDLKFLATAIAEVAAEEAAGNPAFAARIRATYHELEALRPPQRTPRGAHGAPGTPGAVLVPLHAIDDGKEIDPYAPPDPYFLRDLYGDPQLRRALERYSLARLQEAATAIEQGHPGTKPRNRGRKAAIIDYIVAHVSGA